MTVKCSVIASTVHPNVKAARITTFQVYAPRFLLAELNTHRLLSRSAESSRAIPIETRIKQVAADPYYPEFTENKPGMQADRLLDEEAALMAQAAWTKSCAQAILSARTLQHCKAHKQHANRLLEPFAHFNGVVTATEWDNFWSLRISPMAQPEFRELATLMKEAYDAFEPSVGLYHLPYCGDDLAEYPVAKRLPISAARCARVSYKPHDADRADPEKDLELAYRLVGDRHMSPFDHQASVDELGFSGNRYHWENPEDHRQYYGWIPARVHIEKSLRLSCRRSSHASLKESEVEMVWLA